MRLVVQSHFTATLPPGKSPGTHCKGRWVGLRAVLDGRDADTISCSHQGLNSESSNLWRFTLPITLSRRNCYQSGIIFSVYIFTVCAGLSNPSEVPLRASLSADAFLKSPCSKGTF